MKKTFIQHPTLEQIAESQFSHGPCDQGQLQAHIKDCQSCSEEAEKIADLTATLQKTKWERAPETGCGRLSANEIFAYVNETGSLQLRENVARHIDTCGQCAKIVLLGKARWFAQQAAHQGDATDPAHGALHRIGLKSPTSSVLWAVAASVLMAVAVLVFVRSHDFGEPPVIQAKNQLLPPSPDFQTPGLIKTSNGISWYDGYIEATGIGTADMKHMANKIQAESMATKAARHIAYAKISEATNGVYISGKVTYQQLLSQSDALVVRHEGMIRNAKIVAEKLEWVEQLPKATVTIRVPLYGKNSLGSVVMDSQGDALTGVDDDQWQRISPNAFTGQTSIEYIIDARGSLFQPALLPVIAVDDPLQGSRYIARIRRPHYFPSIAEAEHAVTGRSEVKILKVTQHSDNGIVALDYQAVQDSVIANHVSLDHVSIVY